MPYLKMTSGAVYQTETYSYAELKTMVETRQNEPWVEVVDLNTAPQQTVLVNLNEVESLEPDPAPPEPPPVG